MVESFRNFETGPDPFGRTWHVEFRWQQNAISIRHADTIDTKWELVCGEEAQEKVVALPLPALMKQRHPITDFWCMRMGALHVIDMISTWQDMDKTLVTLSDVEVNALSER